VLSTCPCVLFIIVQARPADCGQLHKGPCGRQHTSRWSSVLRCGWRKSTCVLTTAGPDEDLRLFDGHELHVVRANSTLTFEHRYDWLGERPGSELLESSVCSVSFSAYSETPSPHPCRRAPSEGVCRPSCQAGALSLALAMPACTCCPPRPTHAARCGRGLLYQP
jgi:hypothetical protein